VIKTNIPSPASQATGKRGLLHAVKRHGNQAESGNLPINILKIHALTISWATFTSGAP
jgi:hypothetical protein